jgi:hypothetical protein
MQHIYAAAGPTSDVTTGRLRTARATAIDHPAGSSHRGACGGEPTETLAFACPDVDTMDDEERLGPVTLAWSA